MDGVQHRLSSLRPVLREHSRQRPLETARQKRGYPREGRLGDVSNQASAESLLYVSKLLQECHRVEKSLKLAARSGKSQRGRWMAGVLQACS